MGLALPGAGEDGVMLPSTASRKVLSSWGVDGPKLRGHRVCFPRFHRPLKTQAVLPHAQMAVGVDKPGIEGHALGIVNVLIRGRFAHGPTDWIFPSETAI